MTIHSTFKSTATKGQARRGTSTALCTGMCTHAQVSAAGTPAATSNHLCNRKHHKSMAYERLHAPKMPVPGQRCGC
jgi:hypothetical protein